MMSPSGRNQNHGEILISLILQFGATKIAEVGIWHGITTLALSKYFKTNKHKIDEYWAVDTWDYPTGHLNYRRACSWMVKFPNLKVLRLESKQAALLFPPGYLDLVFIDADHSYKAVKRDIKWWFSTVKPGGILCGHDYCEKKPGVVKAVDEAFKKKTVIIPPFPNVWAIRKKLC